jgi:hypothetical protein
MVANIGIQQFQHKMSIITSIKKADDPIISRNNNMEGGKVFARATTSQPHQ